MLILGHRPKVFDFLMTQSFAYDFWHETSIKNQDEQTHTGSLQSLIFKAQHLECVIKSRVINSHSSCISYLPNSNEWELGKKKKVTIASLLTQYSFNFHQSLVIISYRNLLKEGHIACDDAPGPRVHHVMTLVSRDNLAQ